MKFTIKSAIVFAILTIGFAAIASEVSIESNSVSFEEDTGTTIFLGDVVFKATTNDEITFKADTVSQLNGTTQISGNVEIAQNGVVILYTDSAEVEQRSSYVVISMNRATTTSGNTL